MPGIRRLAGTTPWWPQMYGVQARLPAGCGVARLGTVEPMSDSPRLPRQSEELAGFAADLQGFTVEAIAERLGPRAVAALDREDPLPADLALAGATDRLALLIRLFLLGGELTGAEIEAALPTSAGWISAWGIIERGRAAIDLRPTTIGERDAWLTADPREIMTGEIGRESCRAR